MAWGVAADANAERADAQARSQGKQKWESEQPSAKEDGNELEDDGSCFQPGFCAPHGVCVKVLPASLSLSSHAPCVWRRRPAVSQCRESDGIGFWRGAHREWALSELLSRCACSPRYGLQSWRGESAGVAKRRRELIQLPPESVPRPRVSS